VKNKTGILRALVILIAFMVGGVLMSGCTKKSEVKSPGKETTSTNLSEGSKELVTAREAYSIAQKTAQDWASDVILVDLSNFRGSSETNGQATRWKLEFNSKSKDKELEVHVSQGKILQTMEEKYKERDAITGEWIDSPKAMEIAHGYFDEVSAKNYWLGLSSSDGTTTWYVKCDRTEGAPIWVEANALTGEFIKTREGY
jgi:major membrane immunogen (membrane-anchored lipoprotein)